jgi:hypothetical protein
MGLFSALLGNTGAVSQEELVKKFGKLLYPAYHRNKIITRF